MTVRIEVVTSTTDNAIQRTPYHDAIVLSVPVDLANQPDVLAERLREQIEQIASSQYRLRRTREGVPLALRRAIVPEARQTGTGLAATGSAHPTEVQAVAGAGRVLGDALYGVATNNAESSVTAARSAFDRNPTPIPSRPTFDSETDLPARGGQVRAVAEQAVELFERGAEVANEVRRQVAPETTRPPARVERRSATHARGLVANAEQTFRRQVRSGEPGVRPPRLAVAVRSGPVAGDAVVDVRVGGILRPVVVITVSPPPDGADPDTVAKHNAEVLRQVAAAGVALRDRAAHGVRPYADYYRSQVRTAITTAVGIAGSFAINSALSIGRPVLVLMGGAAAVLGTVLKAHTTFRKDRSAALLEAARAIAEDPSTAPPERVRAAARAEHDVVETIEQALAQRQAELLAAHPQAARELARMDRDLGPSPQTLDDVIEAVRQTLDAEQAQLLHNARVTAVDATAGIFNVQFDLPGAGRQTFTFDVVTGQSRNAVDAHFVGSDVHATVVVDPQASPDVVADRVVALLNTMLDDVSTRPDGLTSPGSGPAGSARPSPATSCRAASSATRPRRGTSSSTRR